MKDFNKIEITENQKERLKNDWSKIAGEEIKISADYLSSPIYAFASELGVYRIKEKMKTGRVGYSKNLETWYYVNTN